jgi:hypothetical protein
MASFRYLWLAIFLAVPTSAALQQADNYVMVAFDETGKLEHPRAWNAARDAIKERKPDHIFIVAHGWRVAKADADETVAALSRWVRNQAKNETVQVIGVRWPSLLGENVAVADVVLKQTAQVIAKSLAQSDNLKEAKENVKAALKLARNRVLLLAALGFRLPEDEQLDQLIDHIDDVENIENTLTILTYYEMKKRADRVGSTGLQECLTQLQEAVPGARIHLVGHSFGCKVCLSCLASESQAGKQIESVTLIQGAVSSLCFAPKIDEVEGTPKGAYADLVKRVKGSISITYTKNDLALNAAYKVASRAAGQVGELPGKVHQRKPALYEALGGKGVARVAEVPQYDMCENGTAYKFRDGLNVVNADRYIREHNDIRTNEVAWLIWSTALRRP